MNARFEIIWFAKDKIWRIVRDDGVYVDVPIAEAIPNGLRKLYSDAAAPNWGKEK